MSFLHQDERKRRNLRDPVNIAVIGAGYWGRKVTSEYLALAKDEPSTNLARVCDVQEQNLRHCSEVLEIPKERLVNSYKELLDLDDVNAVHICTPNETHYQICREALMAGKHVLLEKPMTLGFHQALELMELAEKEELVLQVGYIFRFNNALKKVQELIKDEFFGDLYYLRLQWTTLMQPTPNRDIIFDLGPHPFDIMNFLLGTWPSKVVCKARAYTREALPEMAYATAEFDEKLMANVELSWLHPIRERSVCIIGSENSAKVDCLNQNVEIFENHGKSGHRIDVQRNNTILDELRHFTGHIRGMGELVNGGPVGPMNVLVLESLRKSLNEDKTVKVDPRFVEPKQSRLQ
jgi:UDP-N-acetylglucosamine 3-dehydrogenase